MQSSIDARLQVRRRKRSSASAHAVECPECRQAVAGRVVLFGALANVKAALATEGTIADSGRRDDPFQKRRDRVEYLCGWWRWIEGGERAEVKSSVRACVCACLRECVSERLYLFQADYTWPRVTFLHLGSLTSSE